MTGKETNKLSSLLYFIVKILLLIVGVVIYINTFCAASFFGMISVVLFTVLFYGVAEKIANLIIYFNTNVSILKEEELEVNLHEAAICYYSFFDEEKDVLFAIDIAKKNLSAVKDVKYVFLDNSKYDVYDAKVEEELGKLKQEFGEHRIRSVRIHDAANKCDAIKAMLEDNKDALQDVKAVFVSSVATVWSLVSMDKTMKKIYCPDNKKYKFFKPLINASNTDENLYTKIKSWSLDMLNFNQIAKWRLFSSICCGQVYVINRDHEKGKTALMEDVFCGQELSENKFAELSRKIKLQSSDLVKIFSLIKSRKLKNIKEISKNICLYNYKELVFAFWFLAVILNCNIRALFLFYLFVVALAHLCVLNVLGFWSERKQEQKKADLPEILGMGFMKLIYTILVDLVDVIYMPLFFIRTILSLVFKKDLMPFLAGLINLGQGKFTLLDVYSKMKITWILGSVLLLAGLVGLIPDLMFVFILPFIVAFLFGPTVIWWSSKPDTRHKE